MKIYFGTPTFDRITKDEKASNEAKLSAVGGTMGLLTGFSIISGVEIVFFIAKMVVGLIIRLVDKMKSVMNNRIARQGQDENRVVHLA